MDTSPAPIDSFSALPLWLQEVLPQWFVKRPAFTELLYSSSESFAFGTAINIAADGGFSITNLQQHWEGWLAAGAIAVYRGARAHSKATQAIAPSKAPTS